VVDLEKLLYKSRLIFYNSLLLLHVLMIVIPEWGGKEIVSCILPYLTFLSFCLALPTSATIQKVLSFIFILLGSMLLYHYNISIYEYINHFGDMLNILLLVAIAPLFITPIQYGDYPIAIEKLIRKKLNIHKHIYKIISGLNFVLASLMHYASIPVTNSSLQGVLPIDNNKKMQSISQSRGFGLAFLWSPVAALSSTAISETEADLLYTLPIMLVVSIIIWYIDGLWTGRRVQRNLEFSPDIHELDSRFENGINSVKIFQFMLVIITFVILLISLQSITSSMNLLDLVSLLIFTVTFIWSAFLKKLPQYFYAIKEMVLKKIPTSNDQFALFLSVGFFLTCINNTPFLVRISSILIVLQESVGGFIIVFLLIIPFFLSLSGIVPVLSISIVVNTIIPESIGLSNEWFTIAVITGAVAGVMSSPFLPPLNIVAQVNNISPYLLSRWNLKFSFFILFFCMILVYVLQTCFPNV
jgi:hypothetical protein